MISDGYDAGWYPAITDADDITAADYEPTYNVGLTDGEDYGEGIVCLAE